MTSTAPCSQAGRHGGAGPRARQPHPDHRQGGHDGRRRAGVDIAGVTFDAGRSTPRCCCRWHPHGEASTPAERADPTALQTSSSASAAAPGKATVSLEVNSYHVILDDIWLARRPRQRRRLDAQHGRHGWSSTATTSRDRLFVEHYQKTESQSCPYAATCAMIGPRTRGRTMHSFEHDTDASRTVFGTGTLSRVADELGRMGARRALVLSTPGQRALAMRVAGVLGDACARALRRRRRAHPGGGDRRGPRAGAGAGRRLGGLGRRRVDDRARQGAGRPHRLAAPGACPRPTPAPRSPRCSVRPPTARR